MKINSFIQEMRNNKKIEFSRFDAFQRFDDEMINLLLELKWWDLPDEIIATLPFNDINACIKELKEIINHTLAK